MLEVNEVTDLLCMLAKNSRGEVARLLNECRDDIEKATFSNAEPLSDKEFVLVKQGKFLLAKQSFYRRTGCSLNEARNVVNWHIKQMGK
jgi:hypothetical protein